MIGKLNCIDKTNLNPGKYPFPDFLIVGPQRTGITWLFKNLDFHPRIYIPPPKELYFFNLLRLRTHSLFQSNRLEWYSAHFSNKNVEYLKCCIRNLLTYKTVHLAKAKGEATASYAAMDEDLINEIAVLNPDIRIIINIRHPVERAWSHAKKDLLRSRGRELQEVESYEFVPFYQNQYQLRCGNYSTMIARWAKIIPRSQVFILVYEDIAEKPRQLLQNILTFLDVSTNNDYLSEDLCESVINYTSNISIPDNHRDVLYDLFKDEITWLNKEFNKLPVSGQQPVKAVTQAIERTRP